MKKKRLKGNRERQRERDRERERERERDRDRERDGRRACFPFPPPFVVVVVVVVNTVFFIVSDDIYIYIDDDIASSCVPSARLGREQPRKCRGEGCPPHAPDGPLRGGGDPHPPGPEDGDGGAQTGADISDRAADRRGVHIFQIRQRAAQCDAGNRGHATHMHCSRYAPRAHGRGPFARVPRAIAIRTMC